MSSAVDSNQDEQSNDKENVDTQSHGTVAALQFNQAAFQSYLNEKFQDLIHHTEEFVTNKLQDHASHTNHTLQHLESRLGSIELKLDGHGGGHRPVTVLHRPEENPLTLIGVVNALERKIAEQTNRNEDLKELPALSCPICYLKGENKFTYSNVYYLKTHLEVHLAKENLILPDKYWTVQNDILLCHCKNIYVNTQKHFQRACIICRKNNLPYPHDEAQVDNHHQGHASSSSSSSISSLNEEKLVNLQELQELKNMCGNLIRAAPVTGRAVTDPGHEASLAPAEPTEVVTAIQPSDVPRHSQQHHQHRHSPPRSPLKHVNARVVDTPTKTQSPPRHKTSPKNVQNKRKTTHGRDQVGKSPESSSSLRSMTGSGSGLTRFGGHAGGATGANDPDGQAQHANDSDSVNTSINNTNKRQRFGSPDK